MRSSSSLSRPSMRDSSLQLAAAWAQGRLVRGGWKAGPSPMAFPRRVRSAGAGKSELGRRGGSQFVPGGERGGTGPSRRTPFYSPPHSRLLGRSPTMGQGEGAGLAPRAQLQLRLPRPCRGFPGPPGAAALWLSARRGGRDSDQEAGSEGREHRCPSHPPRPAGPPLFPSPGAGGRSCEKAGPREKAGPAERAEERGLRVEENSLRPPRREKKHPATPN
ncbi:uncharacterized protein [Notamacropus eugenii]|uniref:uncharacterized protein n=1 Tax=Notamacropus eugenii TaxID=9315 RepID=UPI003B684D47